MGNSNRTCIVSVAFRSPYTEHSNKQWDALRDYNKIRFVNELPYSEGIVKNNIVERFQKSLYGFKPHAIQHAIDMGYNKIIWFDPSVMPLEDVSTIYEQLEDSDMLIVPGKNHIKDMTNQKAFEYFGDRHNVNHIGGTIYAFNFNSQKTIDCFNIWKQAENDGIFGNQAEFMAGHWADESCMALSMSCAGIEQKRLNFKYANQKEL